MSSAGLVAGRFESRGALVLDGAMATELERAGHDLGDALWSARLLAEDPAAIRAVHRAYLEAGADVISSAGYQASVEGFQRAGHGRARAEELCRLAVRLALEERDAFAAGRGLAGDRLPLVAVSLGPWAALLADGSEYRGYAADVTVEALEAWHRARVELALEVLRAEGRGAEVLAFETVPSLREVRAIARVLAGVTEAEAWVSFSCADEAHVCEGQEVEACARALEPVASVRGVGVNCTDPRHVPGVLERLRRVSSKWLVAYPNSGERYEAGAKAWSGERADGDVEAWYAAGARVVGGCCRTGPADVARWARWREARFGA